MIPAGVYLCVWNDDSTSYNLNGREPYELKYDIMYNTHFFQ